MSIVALRIGATASAAAFSGIAAMADAPPLPGGAVRAPAPSTSLIPREPAAFAPAR